MHAGAFTGRCLSYQSRCYWRVWQGQMHDYPRVSRSGALFFWCRVWAGWRHCAAWPGNGSYLACYGGALRELISGLDPRLPNGRPRPPAAVDNGRA